MYDANFFAGAVFSLALLGIAANLLYSKSRGRATRIDVAMQLFLESTVRSSNPKFAFEGRSGSLRWLRLRATHWLPQALRVLRICPRSQPRSVQAVRPLTAIARSRQFALEKVCSAIEAPRVLNRSAKLPVGFMGVSRGGLASSRRIHLQVQLKRRSCGLCLQRWYASPSKFKARLRLTERGLTLPSSGRAFGTPLKSNVRPRNAHSPQWS